MGARFTAYLRYAVRAPIKAPGFTLVGIISLGLGMGGSILAQPSELAADCSWRSLFPPRALSEVGMQSDGASWKTRSRMKWLARFTT